MAINNWRGLQYDSQWRVIYNPANDSWMVWGSAPQSLPFSSWDEAVATVTNIVEWTQQAPYSQPFSTADSLKLQMEGYQNMWDNTLADAYKNLWNWVNSYSNVANQIWDFYWALANDVIGRENQLGQAKANLANQLNQDLLNQRGYVMDMFGPNWTLTNEINQYYTDMWNYLATEAGREAANIAAQWVHSWASLWAIRAQQNEAYNNAYGRYLQAKEQEINAKQQIASNLINYMSTLRKEYWDTTNQYIIWQYQRANDLLNSINTDLNSQYSQLAAAQLNAGSWWGSGWTSWLTVRDILKRQWLSDEQIQAIESSMGWDSSEWGNTTVVQWENQPKEQLEKPTGNWYNEVTPGDAWDYVGLWMLGPLYPFVRNVIR